MPCDTTRALLRDGIPPERDHITHCDDCADLRGRTHLLLPVMTPTPKRLARAYRSRRWRRAGLGLAATALFAAAGASLGTSRDDDHGAQELAALVEALDALDAETDLIDGDPLPGDVLIDGAYASDALGVVTLFGDAAWP
jgi:hypothetical protein